MAKRVGKPQPAKTLTVLPMQLQPGDTFTDETDTWEVIGRPTTERGGKQVKVNVQAPGDPSTRHEKWWPAYERVTITRAAS